jgi:hypothetical protein
LVKIVSLPNWEESFLNASVFFNLNREIIQLWHLGVDWVTNSWWDIKAPPKIRSQNKRVGADLGTPKIDSVLRKFDAKNEALQEILKNLYDYDKFLLDQ